MPLVTLDSHSPIPLIAQIVASVQKQIDDRAIRTGMRMPSIRRFAGDHGISRFTVVQAYDRLVAMSYLNSRQGSGFYVAQRPKLPIAGKSTLKLERAMDVLWLLRNALQQTSGTPMPAAGCCPVHGWMKPAFNAVCAPCPAKVAIF